MKFSTNNSIKLALGDYLSLEPCELGNAGRDDLRVRLQQEKVGPSIGQLQNSFFDGFHKYFPHPVEIWRLDPKTASYRDESLVNIRYMKCKGNGSESLCNSEEGMPLDKVSKSMNKFMGGPAYVPPASGDTQPGMSVGWFSDESLAGQALDALFPNSSNKEQVARFFGAHEGAHYDRETNRLEIVNGNRIALDNSGNRYAFSESDRDAGYLSYREVHADVAAALDLMRTDGKSAAPTIRDWSDLRNRIAKIQGDSNTYPSGPMLQSLANQSDGFYQSLRNKSPKDLLLMAQKMVVSDFIQQGRLIALDSGSFGSNYDGLIGRM